MRSNNVQPAAVSRRSPLVLAVCAALAFSAATTAQQYTFDDVASGLTHQNADTRLRAIEILQDAGYPEAAGPIAAVLADPDDRVQLSALEAERSLLTTRVVPRRRKIGFVVEVRSVAGGDAAAAGQLALKPRAIPAALLTGLAIALRDNNPRVRGEAIGLAALLGPVACAAHAAPCAGIGDALIENINSRESHLRRAAMQALGRLRHAPAVQALHDRFSYHQSGPDAMAALEGLAGIAHPTSVSVFEDLLTHSNADMRRFAVEGLARAGSRDVLPMLQQMGQTERSNDVLVALHYANARLSVGGDSLQQLVALLRVAEQRPLVLEYLLDLSPSVAPALAASLSDESADVRRLIADVLGFSRNRAVIPALEAAMKDNDADVAAAAQQARERLTLPEPRVALIAEARVTRS